MDAFAHELFSGNPLRSRRSRTFGANSARSQQFALEGDFGKHFRLYAPGGDERDALYIFTPDPMAVLIDHAATYDFEFVDTFIYFSSPRKFPMRDPVTYSRSNPLANSVVAKVLKRTRSYSGFRTIGDFVAVKGAPLARVDDGNSRWHSFYHRVCGSGCLHPSRSVKHPFGSTPQACRRVRAGADKAPTRRGFL